MSDQPPSKLKPGSLRDRIAAFENKPAAAPGPPAPRPKPAGGVSWKPKPPSPPSSPQSGSASGGAPTPEKKAVGGMSASDAKESIGMGGSLKDRMAALQGRGAFGGFDGGAPVSPKPATQKPKWKPPPVVSPPADDTEGETPSSETGVTIRSPPPTVHKSPEDESSTADIEPTSVDGEEEAEEHDPEEAERQRRAAIAARMARLGGARVGMAPPVFGKKPLVKKTDPPRDEETQSPESKPTSSSSDPSLKSPPIEGTPEVETRDKSAEDSGEYFAGATPRRSSTSSSLLSVDSASQASKSPTSMPVPSVPRRAAPPRKKIPKSPSPVPDTHVLDEPLKESPETSMNVKTDAVAESEHELQTGGDRQEEIGEVDKEVESVSEANKSHAPRKPVPMLSEGRMVDDSPQVDESENEAEQGSGGDRGTREPEMFVGELAETHKSSSGIRVVAEKEATSVEPVLAPLFQSSEGLTEEPAEALTGGEEEAARRKRVAEKLGKMGGVSPLAPLPISSADDEVERGDSAVERLVTSPSSPKSMSNTTRQSKDSATAPSASPPVHQSTVSPLPSSKIEVPARKESTKSVESVHLPEPVSREDDLSQHHKDFRADHELGRELDDEIRGNQPQEGLSPDREHSIAKIALATHERNEEGEVVPARTTRSVAPPAPAPPAELNNTSARPDVVHYRSGSQGSRRRSLPPPEFEAQPEAQAPPVAPRPSRRSIPPPPAPVDEETVAQSMPQQTQSSMPPLPRQSGDFTAKIAASPAGPRSQPRKSGFISVPGTSLSDSLDRLEQPSSPSSRPVPLTLAVSDLHENEILDEEQGDPIDPAFHSPNKTPPRSGDRSLPPPASQDPPVPLVPVPVPVSTDEEDPDHARRRTIAERMAKLGGIKLGAPPSIGHAPPSAPRIETISEQSGTPAEEGQLEETSLTEEDEERARKQRIASKLAGMGGVGMFGTPQRIPPQPRVTKEASEPTTPMVSSPPQRAVPPSRPPPPQQQPDTDSEPESHHTSEDGVKVEAEDSELEEVYHEDAFEPEAPPPVPSRSGRRSSNLFSAETAASPPPQKPTQSPPPLPGGRPPIPSLPINRQSSVRKSSADYVPSSAHMGSFDTSLAAPLAVSPPSEYVMVEEPINTLSEEAEAQPPPSRSGRGPPSHPVPQSITDSSASGWELPSIPTSLVFDGPQLDLSLSSWSEDLALYPAHPAPAPPQSTQQAGWPAPAKTAADIQLSADDLMAVWGRVGVQICESATTLFEKSKKSLVGDGSYYGFVNAVFSQVPNAMPPSSAGYGYLIYAQTGSSVSRRVSEILPGDVVELYDAKLKGHKGLQSYHQDVGAGEPLVGIVNEFEAKKSKVKIFHANQHVGQQTVESVSYRLEDLKSGVVKIFRVLEA